MNELAVKEAGAVVAGFGSAAGFELIQRQASALSKSTLVPKHFQGNLPDCIIALEMAQRIGASPLMVCQNLYVVHGNPSFSSKFLIACINASGRFSPLRYKYTGEKNTDSWGCIAWAKDEEGEILESAEVTLGMAKAEGWEGKNGSKWKTMPQLMLQYRSAAFFCRTYAPEVGMGMMTTEEAKDMQPATGVVVEPIFDDPLLPDLGENKDLAPEEKPAIEFGREKAIKSLEIVAEKNAKEFKEACENLEVVDKPWADISDEIIGQLLAKFTA